MTSPTPYILVDRPADLATALAALTSEPSLALDLEMENSYRRYGLHIALIQVSTRGGRNYIFDPLSGIDIPRLGAILTRRASELVIHDADFDRRACRQVYGWTLTNIFDTKLAAQLCGYRQFGLGSLLKQLLGLELDKRFQTHDWLQRPLRPDALDYAARDTASLHALRTLLDRRLEALGRQAWAREEFRRLETFAPAAPAAPAHYRIKKSALLTPRQLAVLGALAEFRDQTARRLNRPVHYIIRDALLLQMAARPPAGAEDLRRIKGLHPAMYRPDTMRLFFQALEQGRSAPEDRHPVRRQRSPGRPGYAQRLKAMQEWRRQAAAPLDLEPYLLLDNDILEWRARHPGQELPPAIAGCLRQWQRELVGDEFQRRFP